MKRKKTGQLISLKKYPALKADKHMLKRVEIQGCVVTLYTSGKLLIQGNSCQKVAEKIKEYLGGTGEVLIGIDEVGRGEREGPFVVCGVLGKNEELREQRDSKKTGNIREAYQKAIANVKSSISISFSPELIDSLRESGVNMNMIEGMAINTIIGAFGGGKVQVDGNPIKGVDAEFIVKGDDLVPVISAASVIAKHVRNQSGKKGIRKTWKH